MGDPAALHHLRCAEASPTRGAAPQPTSMPSTVTVSTAPAPSAATASSSSAPRPLPHPTAPQPATRCAWRPRWPAPTPAQRPHSPACCLAEACGFDKAATERERQEHSRRVADAVAARWRARHPSGGSLSRTANHYASERGGTYGRPLLQLIGHTGHDPLRGARIPTAHAKPHLRQTRTSFGPFCNRLSTLRSCRGP